MHGANGLVVLAADVGERAPALLEIKERAQPGNYAEFSRRLEALGGREIKVAIQRAGAAEPVHVTLPPAAFDFGDELPGEVVAFEVDAICPDEAALYIPTRRALACADGVVRWPGNDRIGFVPDRYMDEPDRTKAGLRDAYRRLLFLEFDHLLLAHGGPVVGSGKAALEAFLAT